MTSVEFGYVRAEETLDRIKVAEYRKISYKKYYLKERGNRNEKDY